MRDEGREKGGIRRKGEEEAQHTNREKENREHYMPLK